MKNWKFNALIFGCAVIWIALTIAATQFRGQLEAMHWPGRFLIALAISSPVLASLALLAKQIEHLKTDEYQQHLLRAQILWAATLAIGACAVQGFVQAYAPGEANFSYVMVITIWFAGFLLRGLSSAAKL